MSSIDMSVAPKSPLVGIDLISKLQWVRESAASEKLDYLVECGYLESSPTSIIEEIYQYCQQQYRENSHALVSCQSLSFLTKVEDIGFVIPQEYMYLIGGYPGAKFLVRVDHKGITLEMEDIEQISIFDKCEAVLFLCASTVKDPRKADGIFDFLVGYLEECLSSKFLSGNDSVIRELLNKVYLKLSENQWNYGEYRSALRCAVAAYSYSDGEDIYSLTVIARCQYELKLWSQCHLTYGDIIEKGCGYLWW